MGTNAQKRITERRHRRRSLKERLMPTESVIVQRQGGNTSERKQMDVQPRSILKAVDHLIEEMPNPGELVRIDLARLIIEDRE